MSISVKVEGTIGKVDFHGTGNLEDMPGNCGYLVLTYLEIHVRGRGVFTEKQKEVICNHVLEGIVRSGIRDEYGKVILSANIGKSGTSIVNTYDFIMLNNLMVGTEVRGAHGNYKNISAEFDVRDSKYKAPAYKGLDISVDVENNHDWF